MVLFAIVVIFLISLWLMVGRRSGFIPHRTAILADFISTLSDRGMPIAEGLDAWSADMPEDRFSMAVVEVTEDVRDGLSLSESFRSRPRYFSHRFAAAIQAGEETGTLPRLMNHFARHDDQAAKNARRALALFLYPMLVTVLMFGFLSIWIIKILPRIQAMYSSAEHELPQFTVWWSTSGGFYLLGFLVFVQFLFFFNAVKVFLPGRIRSDSFLASILGLYRGKEMRLRTVGVFLETLSELLDAEVPTGKAVELARGAAATGGRDIEMQNIQESVTEGEEISTAIIRGLDLNKSDAWVLSAAEGTDAFPGALSRIAGKFHARALRAGERMAQITLPVCVLLQGLLVLLHSVAIFGALTRFLWISVGLL